ncbi:MAG: D-glycero-beta-D-manno-heptose 1-phosphate adenylyltransferase [Pirellulales bacterium]
MKQILFDQLTNHLDRIGRPRIFVLGDLMVDQYTWGTARRVSPEAPVLVLLAENEEARAGGAASVAALLAALDADVVAAGVLGDDAGGRLARRMMSEAGIDQAGVLADPSRPTTLKQRFLGRAGNQSAAGGHQVLRVDRETRQPLSPDTERGLKNFVRRRIAGCQALLISDYDKGVCTPGLVSEAIAAARDLKLPVLVDPPRPSSSPREHYGRYRGASLLKPNRLEAELATGRKILGPSDALQAGRELCRACHVEATLVTLDAEGMALAIADKPGWVVPAAVQNIRDVTGAGDIVLAMLGLCLAAGCALPEAARLANVAAGLEVQKVGVQAVSRGEIRTQLDALLEPRRSTPLRSSLAAPMRNRATPCSKILTLDEAVRRVAQHRRNGQRIVFTNGCFDILHAGHVSYLHEAAALGHVLLVAINSDASVRALKGSGRPVNRQAERAAVLAALASVDYVVVFDEPTPHELLFRLRPELLVKGGTYLIEEVVGREIVEGYGGQVLVLGWTEGVSTSRILASVNGASRT